MARLEHIEAIEKRPWNAADALRANSNYASNEYFLTQFADQKAHDGGEFFMPVSLVSLIANVLEPQGGKTNCAGQAQCLPGGGQVPAKSL